MAVLVFDQFDNGQVSVRITADQLGRVIFLSPEADGKFGGTFDHVVVGQDIAVLVDYRSGA